MKAVEEEEAIIHGGAGVNPRPLSMPLISKSMIKKRSVTYLSKSIYMDIMRKKDVQRIILK